MCACIACISRDYEVYVCDFGILFHKGLNVENAMQFLILYILRSIYIISDIHKSIIKSFNKTENDVVFIILDCFLSQTDPGGLCQSLA